MNDKGFVILKIFISTTRGLRGGPTPKYGALPPNMFTFDLGPFLATLSEYIYKHGAVFNYHTRHNRGD